MGIDETPCSRGHKYIAVVVDHDGVVRVRAAPGRWAQTGAACFDALGGRRAAQLTHVPADGADWIAGVVTQRAPQAVLCADPFHVVSWATGALDEVRREAWRQARTAGQTRSRAHGSRGIRPSAGGPADLKRARYPLR